MSKRIVMRSVAAVAVLGFILSFSSCQKDEKKIIGTWKYESVEIKELSCPDPLMAAKIRLYIQEEIGNSVGGKVEFTKNGMMISSDGSMGFYKVNDSELIVNSMMYYGISFPNKKTMLLTADMTDIITLLAMLVWEEDVVITKCIIQETLKKE
jgi:hypothetical protein